MAYISYAIQAFKITAFCLFVTYLCKVIGASDQVLLVSFYTAVLTAMATFSVKKKRLTHLVLGGTVVVESLLIGSVIGFYYPIGAQFLAIVYASLAFYLPKKQYQTDIFVMGALTFFIFAILPFSVVDAVTYAPYCMGVIAIFMIFHLIFRVRRKTEMEEEEISQLDARRNCITAIITFVALSLSWLIGVYLSLYYDVPQMYWIELTALVVIQGTRGAQNIIHTSLKRMLACTIAAVILIFLFHHIIPMLFFWNVAVLTIFLFFVFFFQFTYLWQVVFSELFVLAITYILGDHQENILFLRVVLTVIGGTIVIITTPIINYAFGLLDRKNQS